MKPNHNRLTASKKPGVRRGAGRSVGQTLVQSPDFAAQISSVSNAVSSANVWELNHADLKATRTFGNDKAVRPLTRTVQTTARDKGLAYTFPKHSLTILTLQMN